MAYTHRRVGGERQVSTPNGHRQEDAEVAQLPGGGHVVVWTDESDYDGDFSRIVMQRYDASGNTLGFANSVNMTTIGAQSMAAVTTLPNGNIVVAWRDRSLLGGDSSDSSIKARVYDSNLNVVREEYLVNTGITDGSQSEPAVTTLASGGYLVTWQHGNSVRGRIFDEQGAAQGSEFQLTASGFSQDVTALANGGFLLVVHDGSAITGHLFNASGTKIAGPISLATGFAPEVTATADGGFMLTWAGTVSSPTGTEITGRRFDAAGNPVGAHFVLNTSTAGWQSLGDVALLSNGDFVVTWVDQGDNPGDTSGGAIRAQVFNLAGEKLGDEILVNTTTAGVQADPQVAALANGRFVITWTDASTGQARILSQIFEPDALFGTAGGETLQGTEQDDYISALGGNDVANGNGGNDVILGGTGNDTVNGGAGNDRLEGGAGNDVADGGDGDDVVEVAGTGVDVAIGGTGTDRLVIDYSAMSTGFFTQASPIERGPQEFSISNGSDTSIDWSGFETVVLTTGSGADSIQLNLNNSADEIRTGAGNDVVHAGGGNDLIDGGTGNDALSGGTGDDVYVVDSTGDTVTEQAGEGTDEVRTGLGDRNDFTMLYAVPTNVEKLTGTTAFDQGVQDNSGSNTIVLGNGNDLIVVDKGGEDVVNGGNGNDFVYFSDTWSAGDQVTGGGGYDSIGFLGNLNLAFGAGQLSGIEQISVYGGFVAGTGPYSYTLTMNDANLGDSATLLVTAMSLSGPETLTFDGSAETNGYFTVLGGGGADSITGGARKDFLYGKGGADSINGGGGNDRLIGGLGADTLTGGAGKDQFRFESVAESTAAAFDTIVDFDAAGGEIIDLLAIDANTGVGGDQAFSWIGVGTAFTAAGQLRAVAVEGGGWRIEGNVDGDLGADLVIAVTNPDILWNAGNFTL